MAFLRFLAVALLWSCSVLASSEKLPTSPDSVVMRKPFVSVEQPADLQSYKRTKREPTTPITAIMYQFQDYLKDAKKTCGAELGFKPEELQKSFLFVQDLTRKEKCLISCLLKRAEIVDENNKLSIETLGYIANIISNKNPLVVSIVVAAAESCNKNLLKGDACEVAHQINKCIGKEIKSHKLKFSY